MSEVSEFDPQLAQALHDLVRMEKDRDRWRRALNDCTPGGSEFAGDPEYCKRYVQARRDSLWERPRKIFWRHVTSGRSSKTPSKLCDSCATERRDRKFEL